MEGPSPTMQETVAEMAMALSSERLCARGFLAFRLGRYGVGTTRPVYFRGNGNRIFGGNDSAVVFEEISKKNFRLILGGLLTIQVNHDINLSQ